MVDPRVASGLFAFNPDWIGSHAARQNSQTVFLTIGVCQASNSSLIWLRPSKRNVMSAGGDQLASPTQSTFECNANNQPASKMDFNDILQYYLLQSMLHSQNIFQQSQRMWPNPYLQYMLQNVAPLNYHAPFIGGLPQLLSTVSSQFDTQSLNNSISLSLYSQTSGSEQGR